MQMLRQGGEDVMAGNTKKTIAAGLVAVAMVGLPAIGSAQSVGSGDQSVVVECGPGQRAVMEHRRINGGTQLVARCEGSQVRGVAYDQHGRALQARPAAYQTYRPAVQSVERAPRRSKTKSALMIAGSTATGAGLGAALKGKRGALIGAALGGGAATIFESTKRR
jgi:hypothetical protein